MPVPFDAYQYLSYLRTRWLVVAMSCGVALAAALVISFVLPKQYTATATILIDPPTGSDLRNSTAVSPVYLESLKSYERFAASDSLFAKAVARFHLADGSDKPSIESLKRRVLKVAKQRDTKILEIDVTLPDPVKAQAMAQYLAGESIATNQSLSRENDQSSIDEAEKQLAIARTELEKVRAEAHQLGEKEPTEGLTMEIDSLTKLKSRTQQELIDTKADVAEWGDRNKGQIDPATASARDRQELATSQVRAASLERQNTELQVELDRKSSLLAKRIAMREAIQARLRNLQANHDAENTRLLELLGTQGYRSERLRLIDPGIVPQKPSWPNVPLNLVASLLIALILSLIYLSITFNIQHLRRIEPLAPFDVIGKRRNE
jgi:polysaccharide biosynthesis transport protein